MLAFRLHFPLLPWFSLNSFKKFQGPSYCLIFKDRPRFYREGILLYHCYSFLSSTFFNFLKNTFKFRDATITVYQHTFILSIPFFNFFKNFLKYFPAFRNSFIIITPKNTFVNIFLLFSLNFF